MDPAILGVAIGLSVLITIGGLRYLCIKGEQTELNYTTNPLLIRKHSKVKTLFV